MTRMFILAVGLVIGMVFNAAPATAQCPTDDSGCEWKAMQEPYHLLTKQRDTIRTPDGQMRILECEAWFYFYVCYRCCNGTMEIRLNDAVMVDKYGRSISASDLACPWIWRFDTEFWKGVDEGIITYGYLQGRYVDCKGGPTVVGSLPDCDPAGNKTIVTYYKANCFKYDNRGVREWRLLPCDGSGLCKQEWALCKKARIGADGKIEGYDMIKERVSVASTGGCYTVPSGDKLVPDCYPSCWP